MNTFSQKKKDVERAWFMIDAKGKVLGHLATKIADLLRGKHKSTFTPHVDCGDYVVVINAGKVVLTGNKAEQKKYYRHSRYPGGLKEVSAKRLLEEKPEMVLKKAISGMLPKNKLRDDFLEKLKIFAGPEHPHEAQQPQPLEI